MDSITPFVSLFTTLCAVVSAASDLCPYQTHDGFFGHNIKFKYCRGGCCGRSIDDVCCNGTPIGLIIGCVAGASMIILIVIILTCCFCAKSRVTSRHVVRTTVLVPSVSHGDNSNPALSVESPDMFHPPPYDVITSGFDKPPSYEEVMQSSHGHQSSSGLGK